MVCGPLLRPWLGEALCDALVGRIRWRHSCGHPRPGESPLPKGTLFGLREYYTCVENKPNVGTHSTSREIARAILAIQKKEPWGGRVHPGAADRNIWTKSDEEAAIADKMADEKVHWIPAYQDPLSRISGADDIKQRLKNSTGGFMEGPGLFFVGEKCPNVARTFMGLPSSQLKDGDVDDDGEDHLWDATRYRVHRKRNPVVRVRTNT